MNYESLCAEVSKRAKQHLDEVRYDPAYSEDGEVDDQYVVDSLLQHAYDCISDIDMGDFDKVIGDNSRLHGVRSLLVQELAAVITNATEDEIVAYGKKPSTSDDEMDSVPSFKLR